MGKDAVRRLAWLADEKDFDCIVGMSLENATYAGGFPVPSQVLGGRSRLVMALITRTGRSRHIVVDMEESLTRTETALDEVVSYNEFTQDPIDLLAESTLTLLPPTVVSRRGT
jgi:hypothetical protein